MVFDHAYCINLDRAKERRSFMEYEFSRQDLDVEFVSAFDSSLHGITKHNVRPEIHPGEFGCLMSNYHVWQDMVKNDFKVALIIEDDIVLADNFVDKLERLKFPKEWDIIYLEYVSPIFENKYNADFNEGRCLGTMFYLITQECAKKLLAFSPKDWRGADKQLAQLPLKFFYATERLANHDLLNSSIGLNPTRIPVYHNLLFIESEYGSYIAFAVLFVILFILFKRLGYI